MSCEALCLPGHTLPAMTNVFAPHSGVAHPGRSGLPGPLSPPGQSALDRDRPCRLSNLVAQCTHREDTLLNTECALSESVESKAIAGVSNNRSIHANGISVALK